MEEKVPQPDAPRFSRELLRERIDEATVDCYGESEETSGLLTMIEDEVEFPFKTELLGVSITVEGVELTDREEIVAVCRRGSRRQMISLARLSLPSPPPHRAEWIAAYRQWYSRG